MGTTYATLVRTGSNLTYGRMAPKKTKKPETEGSPKKVKAPAMKGDLKNPPKSALTAYLHFVADQRRAMREANPGANFPKNYLKGIGKNWRALNAIDKNVYVEMAKKDEERYNEEVEAFTAAGGTM